MKGYASLRGMLLPRAKEDDARPETASANTAFPLPDSSIMQGVANLDEFDELLRRTIEKTITFIFGYINARVIFNYLEKKGCGLEQIPAKPRLFSAELSRILGPGRGQLLGAAPILEEAILEALCGEIKVEFDRLDGKSFADRIETLRESYRKKVNEGSPRMHVPPPKNGNEDPVE